MSAELTNGASAPLCEKLASKTGNCSHSVGFHYLPESVYHGLNACSQTRLKKIAQSPAHLLESLKHPTEPTDAMKLGTLIHKAVLEPEAFQNSYIVVPDLTEGITTKDGKPASNPRATSEYKERFAAFAKANAGKEFVSAEDWESAQAISERLHTHETIGVLLGEVSQTELSALWQDSETGLLCKARIDADSTDLETVIDIKTTRDASPAEFEKTIYNLKYHWQAAMYLDAMAALGKTRNDFLIIAVETEAPYACAVYNLRSEIIDLARREMAPLKRLYAECVRTGNFPGYPTGVTDIGLPAWAKSKIEKEMN